MASPNYFALLLLYSLSQLMAYGQGDYLKRDTIILPNYQEHVFVNRFDLSRKVIINEALFSPKSVFDTDGAIFKEQTSFSITNFTNQADFTGAFFRGQANFSNANFDSLVTFSHGHFDSGVSFSNACFSDEADIYDVDFDGKVSFKGADFHGPVSFLVTRFNNKVVVT